MIGEEYIDKEYIYITHTHVGCIEPPRPPPRTARSTYRCVAPVGSGAGTSESPRLLQSTVAPPVQVQLAGQGAPPCRHNPRRRRWERRRQRSGVRGVMFYNPEGGSEKIE